MIFSLVDPKRLEVFKRFQLLKFPSKYLNKILPRTMSNLAILESHKDLDQRISNHSAHSSQEAISQEETNNLEGIAVKLKLWENTKHRA